MPVHGSIQDHIVRSRALGRSMRVCVYLPPRYGEFDLRYPVIYLLHPWGRTERFWIDELDLHALIDRLINAGIVPPFIAAMPQGDKSFFLNAADPGGDFSRIVRLDPDYYEGALEGCGRYAEHLLEDVLPYVEKNFQTRHDRASRAVGGMDMGAAGAAVLALTHAQRFATVGIHSPILYDEWRAGPPWIFGLGDEEAFSRRDPIALVRGLRPDNGLRIYLDCGVDDEMSEQAANLHWALNDCGVPHTYVSQPGGHDTAYWSAHLAEYLGFYAGGW